MQSVFENEQVKNGITSCLKNVPPLACYNF